jgi:hypothetical protein
MAIARILDAPATYGQSCHDLSFARQGATIRDRGIVGRSMNEDVRETLREMQAVRQAEARARAEILSNWERLRELRRGLAAEVDRLLSGQLDENPVSIAERRRKTQANNPDSPSNAAARARLALEEHRAAGKFPRNLSPGWRGKDRELAAACEKADRAVQEHESLADYRERVLMGWARKRAAANAEDNARAATPHAALRRRLAGIDRAMHQIEQGDSQTTACLRRWDLDAMVRCAAIRTHLDIVGRVGDTDWEYYCAAGTAGIAPAAGGAGAPLGPVADEGDILRIATAPDGSLIGTFKKAYAGLPAGTDMAALDVVRLAETLGNLHLDGLAMDADLLEGYLDRTIPAWRDRVAEAMNGAASPQPEPAAPVAEDPWDVLGVTRETPIADIKATFAAQMQVLQHLPNPSPQRRLIAAYKAIRDHAATHGQAKAAA